MVTWVKMAARVVTSLSGCHDDILSVDVNVVLPTLFTFVNAALSISYIPRCIKLVYPNKSWPAEILNGFLLFLILIRLDRIKLGWTLSNSF